MSDDPDDDDALLDEDAEWEDDDASEATGADIEAQMMRGPKPRDWRDLERYREERELQKLMQDDWLEEL